MSATARNSVQATLAERWNGRRWTIQRTPSPLYSPPPTGEGALGPALSDVSCPSRRFCVAVGNNGTYDLRSTLIERWSGSAWSIQLAPRVGPLAAVSCTSRTACTAVGTDNRVIRWNGAAWSVQRTPNSSFILKDVSCTSATACVAVGGDSYNNQDEFWDGTTWSVKPIPSPGGASDFLVGVACASKRACMAVGSVDTDYSGDVVTEAERWNGRRWSAQKTEDLGLEPSLSSVSCTRPASCVAVGATETEFQGPSAGLLERFNGIRWTAQPIPPRGGAGGASLADVACLPRSGCIAVGSATDGSSAMRPMAGRYF